ncbi:MAG: hypothetical protein Fur0015_09520 [Ignavibacteriales bacterium]
MSKFLSLLSLIILLVGCDSSKKESATQNDFSNIKIDSTRISNEQLIVDNYLKINSPKDWSVLNSPVELKKFSIGNVTRRDENLIIMTKFILSGKSQNQLMTISEILPDTNSASNFIDDYYKFLRLKFRNDEISFSKFELSKKNIDMVQTKKQNLISLKFLISSVNKKIYQIEFTFLNTEYENLIQDIKSSVASMKF